MTFRFVEVQNAAYPVTILCRVRELSRGGYYAWLKSQALRQRAAIGRVAQYQFVAGGVAVRQGVHGVVPVASGE